LVWTIEFDERAEKQLSKTGKTDALRIRKFLRERVEGTEDPRRPGKALVGAEYKNLWRYRVGDYRILCNLQDNRLVVSSSKSDIVVKSIGKALAAA
jgi:mRNA interferase RelE/StbE